MLYNTYSNYLKETYGEKVYKLPVNLPISCPNRECGNFGCSFCAEVGTGFEARDNTETVREQLQQNKAHIQKKYHANKFIAYFQNYTNTWMPVDVFSSYIYQAAVFEDIVEISVSTRPDCIKKEYLDILADIKKTYHINITIELGLQTVNYHTLEQINRGHGLAAFICSVLLIASYGFSICTHLILNLPNDTMRDVKESVDIISSLPISIVKLHSLYIPKNTTLSYEYEHGRIQLCSSDEYLERLVYFIEHLRPDVIVERLFSRIPEEDSIFSNWGKSWWTLMDDFTKRMQQKESYQGKYYIPANERAYHEITMTGW